MKFLLLIFSILYLYHANAQNFCIDSSTHIQYKTLTGDSIRIGKTILTSDSGKISIGFFLEGINRDKAFISRINKKGEVEWFKKIVSPYNNGQVTFESIEEAANGNIFITTTATQPDNKPYFYLVLSPLGNIIFQNKIGFSNIPLLGNRFTRTPLISKFGLDSMLIGFYAHPENGEGDLLTLAIVSNNGLLGQAYTFMAPIATIYSSYFDRCKVIGNVIDLYGSALHWNNCVVNFFEQPAFAYMRIDWSTKQVIIKKLFCSPTEASGFGYFHGQGDAFASNNSRQIIFFPSNGNIVFTRSYMGLEFNGTDTVNRLFSVSEFDDNFDHIKSEYITTGNQFKRECHYELLIDSANTRFVRIHDLVNKQFYHAAGNSNNYFFQKKQSFLSTKKNNYSTRQNLFEPGYFTSFNIISADNNHTYIDNFKIKTKDTAASCFGINTSFLSNKPAAVSAINWQGNFTVQQAVIESAPVVFTLEDYVFQRTIICNILNICDTIKLNAPETICDITQPVIITAHKNPLCSGKINFSFDTAQVQSYLQINDTTLSLTFNQSYSGRIYARPSSCDKLIDSIDIVISPPFSQFSIGNDTLYCPGKSYLLNAYSPNFKTYQWQDGSTDSIYLATVSGIYHVTVTDHCDRTYSDTIRVIDRDYKINLGKDSTICINESMLLSVPSGYTNYNWQPHYALTHLNSHSVSISPKVNTSYSVEAEVFSGCKLSDTINITVKICPQYIYFPNSFTPNNDGLNETFKPLIGETPEKYELLVFNRWGQLLFRTTNTSEGWTGKIKGVIQNNGTFVWMCKFKFYDKPEELMKGTVTILK